MRERREALGRYFLKKHPVAPSLKIPDASIHDKLLAGTDDRNISTTMAFVHILNTLIRDKMIGKNIVPIVPDETRTFGTEDTFRQLRIYSSAEQLYEPVNSDQVMYYREDKSGQILKEGIRA